MRSKLFLFSVILSLFTPAFMLADEWKYATPGYAFSFPRDHGKHPEYQVEWWYFTGNLSDRDKDFGFELTFFRFGISRQQSPSSWALQDLYSAHFALTNVTDKKFIFFEKISRPPLKNAGASADTLKVWNEAWGAELRDGTIHLSAEQGKDKLKLSLSPVTGPILHGDKGYSQKGDAPTNATNYYSISRLQASGEVTFNGAAHVVKGLAWMDHEFGTSLLDEGQSGWDWLSLHLNDGRDLMLFQLRRKDGTRDPRSSGTMIASSNSVRTFRANDFQMIPLEYWKSRKSGRRYPIKWRVELPSEGLNFEIFSQVNDQELHTEQSTGVTYWEGCVEASQIGKGYLEMTGY